MIASNIYLKKFYELKLAGYTPELEPGMFIGRGFADLGFELFLYLPNGKLLSLFSGQQTSVDPHDPHLFRVCISDELIEEILNRGWSINEIEHRDRRNWEVIIRREQREIRVCACSISEALVEAFAKVLLNH